MNDRLKVIESYICDGVGIIDVGTDHGFLPILLARNGYTGNIIASDIAIEPLSNAKHTASAEGVSDRIKFTLADGLDSCSPDEVDTIVVAGMGGDTITGILDKAEWCMDKKYRFILQPMTKAEVLRFWLVNNGITIISETIVKDAGKLYSVIYAAFSGINQSLNDGELFTGKTELIASQHHFTDHMNYNIERLMKISVGLKITGADKHICEFYDNIINDMIRTKEYND